MHISQRVLMRTIPAVLTTVYCLYVWAHSTGMTGVTQKGTSPGCTCHGLNPTSGVTVSIGGPDTLSAGESGAYTLTISGGSAVAGGTDIAASNGLLAPVDGDLQAFDGELTHTAPKSFSSGSVSFAFTYTAPGATGTQTLYANGNSVNLNGFNSGDTWNFAPNKTVRVAGVTVVSPNGAEVWTVGTAQAITWSSAFTANVKIEYSTDNGGSWTTVVASTPAAAGSFGWTVPNTPGAQTKVRVSDPARPASTDMSNAAFTILPLPPGLQVTSPNGGEQWVAGSTHNVTWSATSVESLRVDYSLDGGASWTVAATGVAGADLSYALSLPNSATSLALVRIVSEADTTVADTSDAVFSLVIGKNLPVLAGWNMVSVPLDVADARKSVLYPSASSNAFAYQTGYVQKDTLRAGLGYWLKFPSDGSVDIAGVPLPPETVAVVAGWNMIGAQSDPLAVGAVASIPGGILTSPFYSYAGSYTIADTIRPGQGYWVKSNSAGSIVLSPLPAAGGRQAFAPLLTNEGPPPPPFEVASDAGTLPASFALGQNYPNPFNPSTVIPFQLAAPSFVRLRLYDALGHLVATLVDAPMEAGFHQARFDALGLPSGVYVCRLQAGAELAARKLLLMK